PARGGLAVDRFQLIRDFAPGAFPVIHFERLGLAAEQLRAASVGPLGHRLLDVAAAVGDRHVASGARYVVARWILGHDAWDGLVAVRLVAGLERVESPELEEQGVSFFARSGNLERGSAGWGRVSLGCHPWLPVRLEAHVLRADN